MIPEKELAAVRLCRERHLKDHEIAEVLGCTREWACKLRRRGERKLALLTRLTATTGSTIDALERLLGADNRRHAG